MKILLWLLALFALAVGASLALNYNDGYLLVVAPPYRAEISLNFALILLLAAFFAGYGLLRVVTLTRALPKKVRAFRERRQRDRTLAAFYDAARLLFEGRFSRAMKRAEEAFRSGHSPALAALLAARSAQRLRDPAKVAAFLEQAAQKDAKMQTACLMLEAEMAVEMRRFPEAVAALKRLHELAGRHIAALRLELRAQQGCGNWEEVLRIARLLEKRQALSGEVAREIKLKAHEQSIRERRFDPVRLEAYRKAMPAGEANVRLARIYAQSLIDLAAHAEARAYIESVLDVEWDSELARLYGLAQANAQNGELAASVARASRWLDDHGDDPNLLLALGRMCLAQRLWGQAQGYLDASLSLADSREARLTLARLFELIERPDEAIKHYRAAAKATG